MKKNRDSAHAFKRRVLVYDLLEDRRVFAGLDVLVFEDPFSLRLPQDSSVPAAHRVVYLDLNADGVHQSGEPLSQTDASGIASFRELGQGAYNVRLLGNVRSVVQTTSSVPAGTGRWTGDLGIERVLGWDSDSVGWFATSDSLIQVDVERGLLQERQEFGGRIRSVAMLGSAEGVAVVAAQGGSLELVRFNFGATQVDRWSLDGLASRAGVMDADSTIALHVAGNRLVMQYHVGNAFDAFVGGELLELKVPTSGGVGEVSMLPLVNGFEESTKVYGVGTQGLLVNRYLNEGTNLQYYHWIDGQLELASERFFSEFVRVSSVSGDGESVAVETSQGIEVLGLGSGLPTTLRLEQAGGATVFDIGRRLLWGVSRANPSRLIGWTLTEGLPVFDRLFSESGGAENALRTSWSLGFRDDALIGLRDGQIYTHGLSIAQPFVVDLVDQVIQQVAIGIRNRGGNTAPTLQPLPSVVVREDQPIALSTSAWVRSIIDNDSDPIQWVVVRGGALGSLQWATSTGGVYTPNPDATGSDSIVVQAYDGRDWSVPQTVGIQIQAINDPPKDLTYSGLLSIPEQRPGYVLGSLGVVDPDANEVYDYTVSDARFEVVGTTLRVRNDANIVYEAPGWIDVVLRATSRANGDFVERFERIYVIKDTTPYHNDYLPQDVDGDGAITPLDPLVIINYLNSHGSGIIQPAGEGESPGDLDVNGDGVVSPLDILIVINTLNQGVQGEGEGVVVGGGRKPVAAPLPDEKLKGARP
jgi:hypothetical protein